jgi:hypothetical protein
VGITAAYAADRIAGLLSLQDEFLQLVGESMLTAGLRDRLKDILTERLSRLE